MKTVYRVQHKDENVGPYHKSDIEFNWFYEMWRKHSSINYPNAPQDRMCREDYHVFGFDSLIKLNQWFEGYIHQLIHEAGFIIAEYQVEEYISGKSGKQVIFIPTAFKDITSSFIQQL